MDYLKELNAQQYEAATTTEGFVRVVAGAGSGKTKTLTARYLYLVEMLGISTANILCVTFTNKAAAEMKKRIRRNLPDMDLGRITTFHGFCVGLLKEDCHVVQYPSTFIVLDEEDKEAMLKTVFEDLGITSKDMTIKDAVDHIGWRKGGRGYVKTLIERYSPEVFSRALTIGSIHQNLKLAYIESVMQSIISNTKKPSARKKSQTRLMTSRNSTNEEMLLQCLKQRQEYLDEASGY